MKELTEKEIRDLFNQVMFGEISFSRMVEMINERVSEAENIPEEPKEGDLAIFWDHDKEFAIIRMYYRSNNGVEYRRHQDIQGLYWDNAIKFESKEQFEKLIKGEI
jgi:hypothetical protein